MCKETFTSDFHLRNHTKTVHNNKNNLKFICETYGKCVTSAKGLLLHSDTAHDGEKSMYVTSVGKSFSEMKR